MIDSQPDGIDLPSLPFAEAAFESIEDISRINATQLGFENAKIVDTHGQTFSNCLSMVKITSSQLMTKQCTQSRTSTMLLSRRPGAGRLLLGMWPHI